jgi:hypothetical protein
MRWFLVKMTLFFCAFVVFLAVMPAADWTLSVKLYAAALTAAGASLLA